MKILILKPSSLGDVVQALPVLRLLKLAYPKSEIFWWIDSGLRALIEDDPDLSGVFCFERKLWASPLHWGGMLASIRAMRAYQFDLVIDLQALARSAAFAWLANGSLTVGLDDPREFAPGFYDLAVPRPLDRPHAVDWYLQVLRALDVPTNREFVWIPPNQRAWDALNVRWKLAGQRWIALIPGARWENKRWPAAYFGELAASLIARNAEAHIVVLGGDDDRLAGEEICSRLPDRSLNLAGRTSLVEMVEWIRASDYVVSNDTGPMHIAAALGKKVWAIFGPTDKMRTGPYGQLHRAISANLPCRPCMKSDCRYDRPLECLRAVTPSDVAARIS